MANEPNTEASNPPSHATSGSYPATFCSVFEVVDATDDENYFTLGVFLSLADAMREVETCAAPDDLGGDHGDHEEYCVVEIRERMIGWVGIGRVVARYEWNTTPYDEAADEYGWMRTQNPTVDPRPTGKGEKE